ncbi:MAG: acyl-CoA dehydrogenase family protein [Roseovarius sp.]
MPATIEDMLAAARRHCEEDILPNVERWNEEARWPRASSDKAAALGLMGLYAPEELGGQGLSLGEGIRVYEELGRGDGAYAFALSMHNICTFAGCGFGTEAFKAQWARELTSGRKLANFALTEPQSGSDPANMYSRATINGDGSWTINGAKAWVSLAGEADLYFTVVKTTDEPGHKDMAMIAIPKDAPGLGFGPLYETPSYNFLPMSEMYMKDVVVSADNIILPVGQGLQGSLMAIDIARVSIASGCCGLMQAALDTALAYSQNRKMFGGRNLDLDGIQWMLGEVATELEASRLLYRAAAEALGTDNGPLMAAHAKRFVPDAAVKAANTCTQVLGGMGLLKPYGMDRLSRLAQMLRIVDGTTEISRVVIGRALQKRAKSLPVPSIPKGFGEA